MRYQVSRKAYLTVPSYGFRTDLSVILSIVTVTSQYLTTLLLIWTPGASLKTVLSYS